MTEIRPRRSALYMPGSNARALEKARSLKADALILDLEDSVAPDMKDQARRQVIEAVRSGGFGHREVVIRVNGLDTPFAQDDIDAAIEAGPDAILVPKVSSADTMRILGRKLAVQGAPVDIRIWAMIETPRAILDIESIAAAAGDVSTRLSCLVMGLNDLSKETGARLVPGRAPMLPWLAAALLAARAHGLDILDGVYNDLSDAVGFQADCEQGRDMGFNGKTLIHPAQIEAANAVFSPATDEVEAARKVVSAFDDPANSSRGAIAIDGRMVERLHAQMARRTLAMAAAVEARG